MKKLINLKGVVTLDIAQQKEVNGASLTCNSNCFGRRGRCFFGGHCYCPGFCRNNYCVPL